MPHRTAQTQNLSQNGQNLVRIVIASYFLAISLGLIPGTAALPLTEPFLPEPYADAASKAIIFATAYLVLVGVWLRFSALLLATVLFWSSYIENIGAGDLEGFWRDLALIGALILTYTQTLPRAERRRAAVRWTRRVRHITPARIVTPRRPMSSAATVRHDAMLEAMPRLRIVSRNTEPISGDNIFRDDPEIALAS
jgi:uncharacterized membrane protein YphA (DoxX/SURF4 family)